MVKLCGSSVILWCLVFKVVRWESAVFGLGLIVSHSCGKPI